jgi:hypothetical protein
MGKRKNTTKKFLLICNGVITPDQEQQEEGTVQEVLSNIYVVYSGYTQFKQ